MTITKSISMPIVKDDGASSTISPHYARSSMHAIVNASGKAFSTIPSVEGNRGRVCIPLAAMKNAGVRLVICRQLGKDAYDYLTNAGIEVKTTKAATVGEALKAYSENTLEDPSLEMLAHVGVMKRCHAGGEHCHEHAHGGHCCGHGQARGHGECCRGHGHCHHGGSDKTR
jgi:predicted Fe-Mo cluster-binding NifX family protein